MMPDSDLPRKVLIVEDSAVVRNFLEEAVRGDKRLVVCGSVETAEEALTALPRLRPDVISMDIHLPGMDGFEATQQIMEVYPTPIVVVSASVDACGIEGTMRALEGGALTVIEKPQNMSVAGARNIAKQLFLMSQVRVIKRRSSMGLASQNALMRREHEAIKAAAGRSRYHMLGIAASTGGPQALLILLNELGDDFPLPILIVQHMTEGFMEGFVQWLNSCCQIRVKSAEDGELPRGGIAYVGPSKAHLILERGRLRLVTGPAICSHLPSANPLFESMATSLGDKALGLILTGMGNDGAEGLKKMKDAGAWTVAESKQTAVVYGMPQAAHQLGAVSELLPLSRIAPRILDCVGRTVRTT